MSDFEHLDGIGDEVDDEQVESALQTLMKMESILEADRERVYEARRVLEVLYDKEPERPSPYEKQNLIAVIENVDVENVNSLEPEWVDENLTNALVELRAVEGKASSEE